MKRAVLVLLALVMALAACGGDDDATSTDAPASSVAPGGGDRGGGGGGADDGAGKGDIEPGSGESTEFCRFANEVDQSQDDFGLDPEGLEETFQETLDALDQARDLAPDEIRDDINMLADAFEDFVELLAEYEYDFLALGTEAADDPRMVAFESEELSAASDRVNAFCGFDSADNGGGVDGPDVTGGGDIPTGSDQLPADFPAELVPPDVTSTSAFEVAGSTTVSFTSSASYDTVVAHYTSELGEPLFSGESGGVATASWSSGSDVVTVTEFGGTTQVGVVLG